MSHHDISDVSDDGEWLDVEPDEEAVTVQSLLGPKNFPTVEAMLDNCKQEYGFDFVGTSQRLQLDFLGAVKLVNFIRDHTKRGISLPSEISAKDIEDDKFLQPVLENDALIFSLDEVLEAEAEEKSIPKDVSGADLSERNRELETEIEQIRSQFVNYRLAVQETLDRRWGDDEEPAPVVQPAKKKDGSDPYFESYAANEIHETMLKDAVRTNAYRDFIYENKQLFKDKVILDIGCGTGILSMFAAKAGAKQVIAVDNSDIIEKAKQNISNNGLSDVITCVRGAIEEVKLPVDQVDVIVSEWMGYCLLYEAMLPSVLYARDKYLKPDGVLAPSSATMWIAPVADPEYVADHISYWRDVYGFDMKAMQEGIYDDVRVEVVPKDIVCGEPFPFKVLDLHTVTAAELEFTVDWTTNITKEADELDGFLIWFDNFFATSRSEPVPPPDTTPEVWNGMKQGNVAFTTGPFDTPTHWKQGLLIAPPKGDGKISPGDSFSGQVTFKVYEKNVRALTIDTSWSGADKNIRNHSWRLA